MQALTIRENCSAAIGARWSPEDRTVGACDVRALDLHQRRRRQEWFVLGHRDITASQWVGTFALGKRVYEILPKLDHGDDGGVRGNLHLMLAGGVLRGVEEADLAPLLRAGKPLLAAYLELFLRRLAVEWRRGPLRRYQVFEENLPYLRGKLLVSRQLRENAIHRERFACARDELTVDNVPARLLKAAVRACTRQQFAPSLAASARTLLAEFDEVGDAPRVMTETIGPLERQHQRFAPLLEMAQLILAEESPSTHAGGAQTFALMFEMFTVFEMFVAAELRKALPSRYRVESQVGRRSLLQRRSEGTWSDAFRLKPDIAVWEGTRLTCLLDTKWKHLDAQRRWNGVAVADVYQMHAYSTEYRAQRTVLVYPRCHSFTRDVDEYRRPSGQGGEPPPGILVRTVDVSSDLSDPIVRASLRDDLRAIVEA